MGDESPKQLYKKFLCKGYLLSTFKKFSRQGLFSAKKIKTKGSFIVGLKKFYFYLLEIEIEEGLFSAKKIKTKGSLIVGLKNFYFYLLEIEIEELVSKK